MSIRHVDAVLTRYAGPSHLKLTLVVLANHADAETGECWPSYETIAAQISSSKRTAIRNVNQLRDEGVVKLIRRGGFRTISGRRRYVSNEYCVPLAALECLPKVTRTRGAVGPVDSPAHSDAPDTVLASPETRCDGDTGVTRSDIPEPSGREPSLRAALLEARRAEEREAFAACSAERERFEKERREERRKHGEEPQ